MSSNARFPPPSAAFASGRLGLFGRLEGVGGRPIDIALPSKMFSDGAESGRDRPLAHLVADAGKALGQYRNRFQAPLAIVGIALGPTSAATGGGDWTKGRFDESKHPRWPEGEPDGGEFRDADGSDPRRTPTDGRMDAAVLQGALMKDLMRTIQRRAARKLLRAKLIAALRFGAGIGADAVPGFGEAFDAYELAQTVADFHEIHVETNAAIQFVEGGARTLDELRVSPIDEGFSSSRAFAKGDLEKRFGPAGDGYEYHHIVEQGSNSDTIAPEVLHSTENMIRIPTILHEEVSAIYGQAAPDTEGLSLREWLRNKSYTVQRERGLAVLRERGIIR